MRFELTLKLGPFLEALSRTAVYQSPKMLRDARTAGLEKPHCRITTLNEWQQWAVRYLHAPRTDFNVLHTNSGLMVSPSCPYHQGSQVPFELMR